jgi:hypothetical protein
VAPEALHGAAFEEYGCADPRAIMKGEPLNVENNVTRSHGAAVLAVSAYAVEAFDKGEFGAGAKGPLIFRTAVRWVMSSTDAPKKETENRATLARSNATSFL